MYSNLMIDQNKNKYILNWLLLITLLVAIMIIVGGLTRLTDSGLSITKWELISGIIPPFTSDQWERLFSLYKKIPEFKLINSSLTLNEFKVIFWWEYIHRLLGRIIGLFYILPLIYFTYKKMLKKNSLFLLYFIFFLVCLQGFIGWYMVTSGLTERTDVSHYRLSAHLTMAFIIFILLLWSYLKYKYKKNSVLPKKLPSYIPILFFVCVLVQISLGALVSGLDAAQIYQSWPLMNESYFPNDSNIGDLISINSLETPSLVQFLHRNLAYLIFVFFCLIALTVLKNKNYFYLRNTIFLIFFALFIQIFLGVLTILSSAQIILASMHQMGSIFLTTASLILVFKNSRVN